MSKTAPVPIKGSASGEHRDFADLLPGSRIPKARSGENRPPFLLRRAPQARRTSKFKVRPNFQGGARDGRTPGLRTDGRRSVRTQRTPKNSGPDLLAARPGCWNSELFGAAEFGGLLLLLLLKLQIAEIIGHHRPNNGFVATILLTILGTFSQLYNFDTSNNILKTNTDLFSNLTMPLSQPSSSRLFTYFHNS